MNTQRFLIILFLLCPLTVIAATPNDPDYSEQNLETCTNLEAAWDIRTDASSIHVAVIDGGFYEDHPDLVDQVYTTFDQIDFDFDPTYPSFGFWTSNNCNNHGTLAAGVIGASGNNDLGAAGVAWNSKLALYRVGQGLLGTPIPTHCDHSGEAIDNAIDRAYLNGARIINRSLEYVDTSVEKMAEYEDDILFIQAAGNANEDNDDNPDSITLGELSNVIQVAAANSTSCDKWSDSNYGETSVHLAAPGTSIYGPYSARGEGSMNGTSFAAPVVAGVAALALAECPAMRPSDLKDIILNNVTHNESWAGYSQTSGLLNAEAVLLASQNFYTSEPEFNFYDKVQSSDVDEYHEFASRMTLDGDTLALSALGADSSLGAVYIRERDQGGTNNWGESKIINTTDSYASENFGVSISLSGDTLAVGDNSDSENGNYAGAVHIFERDQDGTNQWGQVIKIIHSDIGTSDSFGTTVVLDNDTLAVYHPDSDLGSLGGGAVYIFYRNEGGTNNWGHITTIVPTDLYRYDSFGHSMDLSGDRLIVGAPDHNFQGGYEGAVYIFERDQGGTDNWGQVKKIVASDGEHLADFGKSVSIDQDRLAVGATGHDYVGSTQNDGAVYIYEKDFGGTNNWGEVQIIRSDSASANGYLGSPVILENNLLIANHAGANKVSFFSKDEGGTDNWGEIETLQPTDGVYNDFFGSGLALTNDFLFVGSPQHEVVNTNDGALYIYTRETSFPEANLTSVSFEVDEGGSVEVFVELDEPAEQRVSITLEASRGLATADEDFVAEQINIIFEEGDTLGSATFTTLEDTLSEDSETFYISILSGCGVEVGEYDRATVSILDNEVPDLVITPTRFSLSSGSSQSYDISLTEEPDNLITIVNITPDSGLVVSSSSIYIVRWNWDSPKTITVTNYGSTSATKTIMNSISGSSISTPVTVTTYGNEF